MGFTGFVSFFRPTKVEIYWLAVEPTHLKNMFVKLGILSSPIFGVKIPKMFQTTTKKSTIGGVITLHVISKVITLINGHINR